MANKIKTDMKLCVGCHSCEIACAVAHSQSKVLEDAIHETPKPQSRVKVIVKKDKPVPMLCRHCRNASCIKVCQAGALYRESEEGPVILDVEKCVGCLECVTACPFGVITATEDETKVIKCDVCPERTAEGLEPACVEACPTKAIMFVTGDETVTK